MEEEKERWDKIYSTEEARDKNHPDKCVSLAINLYRRCRGEPGAALDVAMGNGRNALALARAGWAVTGIDISEVGAKTALERAEKLGVKLNVVRQEAEKFEFGSEQWDLVVFSYFQVQAFKQKVQESLKHGGMLAVEHFSLCKNSYGEPIGYASGELPKLFPDFHTLHYDEPIDISGWEPRREAQRLVRFIAQQP